MFLSYIFHFTVLVLVPTFHYFFFATFKRNSFIEIKTKYNELHIFKFDHILPVPPYPHLHPQVPVIFLSLQFSLHFLEFYKQIHTIHILFSAFFDELIFSFIHVFAYIDSFLLRIAEQYFILQAYYLLIDIQVVSSFWLLKVKLL